MPDEGDLVEIIHAGAAERAIARREAGRLDEMRLDRQTGGEPENRPGILGDIRLIKGDAHATGGRPDPAVHPSYRDIPPKCRYLRPSDRAASCGLALSWQGCQ